MTSLIAKAHDGKSVLPHKRNIRLYTSGNNKSVRTVDMLDGRKSRNPVMLANSCRHRGLKATRADPASRQRSVDRPDRAPVPEHANASVVAGRMDCPTRISLRSLACRPARCLPPAQRPVYHHLQHSRCLAPGSRGAK
jgi:hypothetical protein